MKNEDQKFYYILNQLSQSFKETSLLILLFFTLSVVGNFFCIYFFNLTEQVYLDHSINFSLLNLSWKHFSLLGALPLVFISLIMEVRLLGWKKSSLNYLLNNNSLSKKFDIVYFFLFCSNLASLLGFMLSLGITYWGSLYLQNHFAFNLLSESHFLLQFALQFLIGSLTFYVHHYISHSSWMWELHKVHHASERMNMVNNFRRHPLEHEIRILIQTVPGALLGINPIVLLAFTIISGLIVVWQHTDYDWNLPFFEKYILIGSSSHRLHHSKKNNTKTKNFGYFVFWDWLFGTLEQNKNMSIAIGIEENNTYNKSHVIAEILQSFINELAILKRKLF